MFKLSNRSFTNLYCVNPSLSTLVTQAIDITKIDFGVIEGLRSFERQKKLVASGASRTMNSKHLTGDAVDLMAFMDGRGSWELPLYFEIAEAMRHVARDSSINIRWGGAWQVPSIRLWEGTMEEAHNAYIQGKVRQGRRPFIDGPHFELNTK